MDSTARIETLRAAVPPAHAGDAFALAGAWFEASTNAGALRLYVSDGARHAVEAAVVLQRCEPLLDALDAWTGSALEWRWIAAATSVAPTASHARAHWNASSDETSAGSPELTCRLELPWTLLRTLAAPGDALVRLHWSAVPMVLVVSQQRIGADELALLEPGGAVVLPESMRPSWHGLLRALDEPARAGWGAPVVLSVPTAPQRIRTAASAVAAAAADGDGQIAVEVRLEPPHAIACDRLATWFEGDLGAFDPRASVWRCATERAPARFLASGRLMPWGDGWALAVDAVHEPDDGGDPPKI